MIKYKTLSDSQVGAIEAEVQMMLHASRDCQRNQGHDTTKIRFDCRDGYYGEAFGVMRALSALGYGEYASDNVPNSIHAHWNLKWWFRQLEDHVLEQEHFGTTNECDHCLYQYGKDAVRRTTKGGDIVPIQEKQHGV